MHEFERVISFLNQSLALQTDVVRDALEKDPKERTPEDLDILLRFTQELEAFKPFTMGVTKAFCEGIERIVIEYVCLIKKSLYDIGYTYLIPLFFLYMGIRDLNYKYLSLSDGVRRSRKGWDGCDE